MCRRGPRRYHFVKPVEPTQRLSALRVCSLRAVLPLIRVARTQRLAPVDRPMLVSSKGFDYSRFESVGNGPADSDSGESGDGIESDEEVTNMFDAWLNDMF